MGKEGGFREGKGNGGSKRRAGRGWGGVQRKRKGKRRDLENGEKEREGRERFRKGIEKVKEERKTACVLAWLWWDGVMLGNARDVEMDRGFDRQTDRQETTRGGGGSIWN